MNLQKQNKITNYLLRRVDHPTLMSIIDSNYDFAEREFDPDYEFYDFNYGIASVIVEDLQIMNHIDLHNEPIYNELVNYFYILLKDRSRKLYDKLTGE